MTWDSRGTDPGPSRQSALLVLCLALLTAIPAGALAEEDEDPEAIEIVLVDITEAAGLGSLAGDRFSFADYDADGDPDLLVHGRTLLRNDTKDYGKAGAQVRFTNVSDETGIAKGPGGGACWVDLDGDGRLDVVTSDGALKIQGKDGRFENRAAAWGLPEGCKGSTVGVGDIDGDGRPDILFGGGEQWKDDNSTLFRRYLLRNVGGRALEDVTKAHDLEMPQYGRAVVFADYDADGDQDVYLGNYRLQPNELLINAGGVLKDHAKELGVQGRFDPEHFHDAKTGKRFGWQYGHTIASSWADLDGDGDLDLWVSNLVHKFVGPGTYQGKPWYDIRGYVCDDSAVYRSDGAPGHGFTDMRAESGIPLRPLGGPGVYRGDELWSNAACGDLDGDGLPEVFVAQVYTQPYSYALLFRNEGDFAFREVSGTVGLRRFNSYGGAFADLDGDGDLDLVCGGSPQPEGKQGVCVLRNDTRPAPWIAFRLKAAPPDTQALGAQVVVETDKGRLVRQVESCMGSHAQQNEGVLRFGLRGRKLLAAWVRWPGNLVQDVAKPRLGQVNQVDQASKLPGFPRHGPRDLPAIELTRPEHVQAGVAAAFRARCQGMNARRWRWSADLDGDGRFEVGGDRFEGRFEAPRGEVRVRMSHAKSGLHVERVVRFEVEQGR